MTFGDRITIDPQICHGQACVKGTRISVHQIVRMPANGDTVDDLLTEYPPLTPGGPWRASITLPVWPRSK